MIRRMNGKLTELTWIRVTGLFCASLALAGCETVANVAQSVADTARTRGNAGAPTPAPAPTPAAAAPNVAAQTAPPPAAPSPPAPKVAQPMAQQPCAANFVVSGSFVAGKQYKTQAVIPNVAPDAAFRKAHAAVVSQGWQINSTDSTLRSIAATQQVSFSRGGKTTPLNVLIQPGQNGGSLILLTYATAGGLHSPEDTVRDTFCQLVGQVTN